MKIIFEENIEFYNINNFCLLSCQKENKGTFILIPNHNNN